MHAVPCPSVQLITGAWRDLDDLEARVAAALRGGIRWVQLRAKDRSARDLYDAARRIAPVMREIGALLVINDRVDVAIAVGAGVHLPEHGLSPIDARRLLGDSAWIARSVHSIDAIRRTPTGLVDAFQFGPVFDTASKREFGAPQGIEELARAAEATRDGHGAALIAVGGITAERVAACRDAGATAVSAIGALWDAGDVEEAACFFVP